MNRFILGSLSIALLTAVTGSSMAYAQNATAPTSPEAIAITTTPFDLVSLAYQGFLESEGIPKFNRLIFAHQAGRIEAEDLVQGAIDTRRLPADTIHNQRYLAAVEQQLDDLLSNSSN